MWNPLILCLFVINSTGEVQSKAVKASEAAQEDVELLQPVNLLEELPVILFATKESKELQKVFGLTKAEIIDGKLASGTTFFTNPPADQILFCPKQDSNEKCLIPKQFKESEILKCDDELIPVLERYSGEMRCGLNDTGVLLMFIYDICPGKMPYRYDQYYHLIYSLCYVETSAKVLFVNYEISAANLLTEKLLIREQEITFPLLKKSYNLIDPNYYADLQDMTQRFPTYGLQTLVPIEDMPLGTMRRATRYYANYILQHKDLMDNWNEIRKRIRNHAIKMDNQILEITTGVFDKPQRKTPTSILDSPTKSVWVTKITARIGNRKEGLAIVMNNFISTGQTSTAQYIDKLCNNEDTSVQNLKQIFEKVKGEVRCCRVTQNIMNLFLETDQVFQSLELLRIDNINQETLE